MDSLSPEAQNFWAIPTNYHPNFSTCLYSVYRAGGGTIGKVLKSPEAQNYILIIGLYWFKIRVVLK